MKKPTLRRIHGLFSCEIWSWAQDSIIASDNICMRIWQRQRHDAKRTAADRLGTGGGTVQQWNVVSETKDLYLYLYCMMIRKTCTRLETLVQVCGQQTETPEQNVMLTWEQGCSRLPARENWVLCLAHSRNIYLAYKSYFFKTNQPTAKRTSQICLLVCLGPSVGRVSMGFTEQPQPRGGLAVCGSVGHHEPMFCSWHTDGWLKPNCSLALASRRCWRPKYNKKD